MPDQRPSKLSTFLGKLTRNLSLNRWELYNAEKRGSGQIPLALDELHECIPSSNHVDQFVDDLALAEIFNRFLATLSKEKRMIFMRRYWYLSPIAEIAADYSMSESKVKMSLYRSRNALKQVLEEEGVGL
jgi:RNA polymerase sigma-70 factor (ECF subfamily)